MFESPSSSFGDDFGEPGGAAVGNQNGGCAGGVGSADNGSQVVRILNAVEQHQKLDLAAREHVFELGIALGGPEGDYALVRSAVRSALESLSRLEADRYGTFAGQIDDLLKTRSPGPPGDQNTVERAPGAQCFAHRMDACQKAASLARFVAMG
jgi:hypothetical protein